jgi:hypothetical protein
VRDTGDRFGQKPRFKDVAGDVAKCRPGPIYRGAGRRLNLRLVDLGSLDRRPLTNGAEHSLAISGGRQAQSPGEQCVPGHLI